MTDEMKERLGEVIYIAPWTELNLNGGEKKNVKWKEEKGNVK